MSHIATAQWAHCKTQKYPCVHWEPHVTSLLTLIGKRTR